MLAYLLLGLADVAEQVAIGLLPDGPHERSAMLDVTAIHLPEGPGWIDPDEIAQQLAAKARGTG